MTAMSIGLTASRPASTLAYVSRTWITALRNAALMRYGAPSPAPDEDQPNDQETAIMVALMCSAHF
jgi:hypothetical protein